MLFGVNSAFGQCGADGTKPCSKTPKKTISSKTTKTSSKKTITQNKASSSKARIKVKRNSAESDTSLRNRIIGEWEGATRVIYAFYSDGTGTYADDINNGICVKFTYTISKGLLYTNPTWNDNSKGYWCKSEKSIERIWFDSKISG